MDTRIIGAVTNGSTVWYPEPTTRGTYSVLSTCIITLLFVLWFSIRHDIASLPLKPEHVSVDATRSSRVWRSVKYSWRKLRVVRYLLLGLIFPEAIAWTAWSQNRETTRHFESMRNILGQDVDSSSRKKLNRADTEIIRDTPGVWDEGASQPVKNVDIIREEQVLAEQHLLPQWTIKHSWFATMGGIILDATSSGSSFLPDDIREVVLTPMGVEALATVHPELFSKLSLELVSDHKLYGKSSIWNFGVLMTIYQVLWFTANVVTRSIVSSTKQGGFTLFELMTFGHMIFYTFVFWNWRHKPMYAKPIVFRSPVLRHVIAWLWMEDANAKPGIASLKPEIYIRNANDMNEAIDKGPWAPERLFVAFDMENLSNLGVPDHLKPKTWLLDPTSISTSGIRTTKTFVPILRPDSSSCNADVCNADVFSPVTLWKNSTLQYHVSQSDVATEPSAIPRREDPVRSTGMSYIGHKYPNHSTYNSITLSPSSVERWVLAAPLYARHPPTSIPYRRKMPDLISHRYHTTGKGWRAPLIRSHTEPGTWKFWRGLTIVNSVVCGIDLLAWNANFHTLDARWTWKFYSLSLPFLTCLGFLLVFVFHPSNGTVIESLAVAERWVPKAWEGRTGWRRNLMWPVRAAYRVFVTLAFSFLGFPLFLPIMRIFLVAAGFVELFRAPVELTNAGVWTRYVPHLT